MLKFVTELQTVPLENWTTELMGRITGGVGAEKQTVVAVGVYGTVPTNTVPVPMTTGTVTDSGSLCRYWFIKGHQ